MRYGTEEQKKRFVPKILTRMRSGRRATRSRRQDPTWRLPRRAPSGSGSLRRQRPKGVDDARAHLGLVLDPRATNPEGPKWAGLSLLLVDMKSPGIEIRPIRQIDGGSEFNEVFLTDVKVPVANMLGKEGQGWEIVSTALVNERSGIAAACAATRPSSGSSRRRASRARRRSDGPPAARHAGHQGDDHEVRRHAGSHRLASRAHESAPVGGDEAHGDDTDAGVSETAMEVLARSRSSCTTPTRRTTAAGRGSICTTGR
jgi:alkylation response protein AidB-like acyl-CoA dehydrogenase